MLVYLDLYIFLSLYIYIYIYNINSIFHEEFIWTKQNCLSFEYKSNRGMNFEIDKEGCWKHQIVTFCDTIIIFGKANCSLPHLINLSPTTRPCNGLCRSGFGSNLFFAGYNFRPVIELGRSA